MALNLMFDIYISMLHACTCHKSITFNLTIKAKNGQVHTLGSIVGNQGNMVGLYENSTVMLFYNSGTLSIEKNPVVIIHL